MAKPRRWTPSPKQKKLLKYLNQGKSIAEAGRLAGYEHRQSSHIAYKNLSLRFHPALERAGLSADNLLTKAIQVQESLLEAKKVTHYPHQGVVIDSREDYDNNVRLAASIAIQRFLGAVGNGHHEESANTAQTDAGAITVNLGFLGPDAEERILNAVRELRARSNPGQPVLDVERHEDQGRSRLIPNL